ncbi:hypothetical protein MWN34_10270 [Ancylobacter sp. 6x-1]|uniref:Uncharacterized protein n=1 Tax=Ancylobacter crimeensis TaxID=2579147 RepID=A0ABT0DBF6_9HYPH|nr:hypothetical protein [Ancylobacter crimeensis]MCK0197296.1 hypothetical protein [Ancylobacter crimeensis]
MNPFDLPTEIVDPAVHRRTVTHLAERGIAVEDFERRRHASFRKGVTDRLAAHDERITAMNRDAGVATAA